MVPPGFASDDRSVEHRLAAHVDMLAGVIGERNAWRRPGALEGSARYIEDQLGASGYSSTAQRFQAGGMEVRNIEVEIRGERRPDRIWIIGAHYDTVDECPGANDNASAVAGLLEIARQLSGLRFNETIRLVAFVNEEPPFYKGDLMGSLVYARRCRERNEDVRGMIALDMLGCFKDEKGSQRYPPPLNRRPWNWMIPNRGNFISFVGNIKSLWFTRRCRSRFKRASRFPSRWVPAPARIETAGMSDHWSFWQQGYRALVVTDTAFFRYGHYHKPTDTPEKLDYARMATVVTGLSELMKSLGRTMK